MAARTASRLLLMSLRYRSSRLIATLSRRLVQGLSLPTARRALLVVASVVLAPALASAHCDTVDGPVVADARTALTQSDVTPVLKWVRPSDEAEIRRAFEQAVRVRRSGGEAQQLADRYFFETLVRVHRAGEGAPYTGLKSEKPEPVIQFTDEALASGSAESLLGKLDAHMRAEFTRRFNAAKSARAEAASSVEAGRRYVAAYVELTHYVEKLHDALVPAAGHHH